MRRAAAALIAMLMLGSCARDDGKTHLYLQRFFGECGAEYGGSTDIAKAEGECGIITTMVDRFNAENPVLNRVTPISNQQYSTTLGGPLITDRLHYFGNFEYEREPRSSIWNGMLGTCSRRRSRRSQGHSRRKRRATSKVAPPHISRL